jgi:hypothetical protein
MLTATPSLLVHPHHPADNTEGDDKGEDVQVDDVEQ